MSRYTQRLGCRYHPEAELQPDHRAGDMICPECGRVVAERMIDVGSEWREFGNESDAPSRNRVGAAHNLLYDNDNLETMPVVLKSARAVGDFRRQRFDKKPIQIASADKALGTGYSAIRDMAGRIGLTKKIIDRACVIYKYSYEKKCLRGRSQEAIVASCIYTACRNEGSARTMKEICGISSVSVRDIGRCYSKLKQSLPTSAAPQSIEIKSLVPRFCSQLELEQKMLIQKTAIHIAECANEICDIQGRAPSSVAGASIYLACLAACEKKTKKDIQGPTGVSEGVIRDIYKIILPHADKLFPSDFVFKCPLSNLPLS